MVKKLIFTILVILSLAFINPSFGQTIIDKRTTATFTWDHDGININHYELQLIRDVSLTEYVYITADKSITITRPKSGVYTVRVRAVGYNSEGLPTWSDWCSSLTPCAINGPWKVRWRPSSPIGPIIISFLYGPL